MLTPQDDLIGHQLPTTFDQIGNSEPVRMERLWYTGHLSPAGDIIFDIGLGYHPNRNVMDAFAGVAVPGRQWNFRAARKLRPDPLTARCRSRSSKACAATDWHSATTIPASASTSNSSPA
ncbi:MAG: hypothetical protein P4L96_11425 [Rhodoferax sp.]|nr:hypothetical protein [Rhodoferax sp.]